MASFNDDTDPIPIPLPVPPEGTRPDRPSSPSVRVDSAGLSHKGNVRENNEDHYLVARVGRSLDTLVTSLPDGEIPERFDETGFAIMVADGMGGAAAGEVASRTAISTLVNIFLDVPDWIMKANDAIAEKLMARADKYYRKLDATLADMVSADPGLQGMGTTMTGGYCIGADMFLCHVGDSRAYLFRDGKLEQLTRDHTHVQQLVDAGMITREEAATHRLRHVLTNAIGGRDRSIDVDVLRVQLRDGDRILLCTDGLTEVVPDGDIADVLGRSKAPEVICRSLVDLALERGGPDNVTVVAARFTIDG